MGSKIGDLDLILKVADTIIAEDVGVIDTFSFFLSFIRFYKLIISGQIPKDSGNKIQKGK